MSFRGLTPVCDMTADCTKPIAMIDENGFIYCEDHGVQRRGWKRCRKLRQHELNKIHRGEPIARY